MTNEQMCKKWGLDPVALEALRQAVGGYFTAEHRRPESRMGYEHEELVDRIRHRGLPKLQLHRGEPRLLVSRERVHNLVTNEGLNHMLDATLSAGTQITAWKVALTKTNTAPLATHTYASPGGTEIAGSDVDETTRQAWTDAGPSGQAITNAASPAVYTAKTTVTIYGAELKGGGSGATTLADTAGGGKKFSAGLYSSSKAMVDNDTLSTEYGFTGADDGV